jgi:AraC-like DNA-binding protein/mannose-6-phosphate isomerase-like protein (cupin superfamily)
MGKEKFLTVIVTTFVFNLHEEIVVVLAKLIMKAQYYKLPKHYHETISIREDITTQFYSEWHYHDVVELVYIIKGKGTRFIGDNISRFSEGDLLLLGPYLPHVWKNADQQSFTNSKRKVHAIVVQFPYNMGGDGILEISEFASIRKLLDDSKLGIQFPLAKKHEVKNQLRRMIHQSPFERLITLLTILETLAKNKDANILSSIPFSDYYTKHKSKRIDKIYNHILNNFEKEITLEELASLANMTSTSLCRFFKQSTQKSLSEFINEVRIGYSCKLIIDGKITISDICFQCGYNNLSYFYRQFKKIIGISPAQYQKKVQSL